MTTRWRSTASHGNCRIPSNGVGVGSAVLVTAALAQVVEAEIGLQFAEGIVDRPDEGLATLGMTAKANDGVAFGMVIGDDEDLAVGPESVGDPLDHVVGGLASLGVQDFDAGSGRNLGSTCRRALAIEENRHRGALRVLEPGQPLNQGFAGRGGMGRGARRELRPGVEQAVSVDEDPYQGHRRAIVACLRGVRREKFGTCTKPLNGE